MKILVTGATSGIGKQLAQDYLEEGHEVYCCGRDPERLSEFDHYPHAKFCVFDIGSLQQCMEATEAISELDLVILNAGTCEYIEIDDFDAESFARVVETNLIGLANCLQALLPKIKTNTQEAIKQGADSNQRQPQAGGQLALMGSSSGYLPLPRAEAYGASKAAVSYLARTLAISLKPKGIGVTYIAPGFVETPLTAQNDFPMPFSVSTDTASQTIRQGLSGRKREIHFPKRFTMVLKVMALLPQALQALLVSKVVLRT